MKKIKTPTTPEEIAISEWLTEAFKDKSKKKIRLAEVCNVSRQSVGDWVKNGQVDKKHFYNISKFFNKKIPSSFYGNKEGGKNNHFDDKTLKVTDINDKNNEVIYSDAPYIPYPTLDWIDLIEWSSSSMENHKLFYITVNSENMSPNLLIGDKILIHTDIKPDNKDVVLVKLNNSLCLREYHKDGDTILLKSTNPDWHNKKFEMLDQDGFIIGVAVQKSLKKY